MKIRTDFVTNSSSSSFVIAYKSPTKEEIEENSLLVLFDTLIDYIKNYSVGDTEYGDCFSTKDELLEMIASQYNTSVEEVAYDLQSGKDSFDIGKAIGYLEKGYKVIFKVIGYHDGISRDIVDTLKERAMNHFLIIKG